jgi:formamidopyrimidine-DNA glycosylase
MPELPEVETTRRGIEPHLLGQVVTDVIVRQPKLRWPIPANLKRSLKGAIISSVTRRGKYLLIGSDRGALIIHLGMSGSLRILPASDVPLAHDHFDLELGSHLLRLRDPRRFGAVLFSKDDPMQHTLLKTLGPEPLTDDFNADYLVTKSRGRQLAIKNLIMDSHVVVGVGNIYASESLFLAGIRPTVRAGKLSRPRIEKLVQSIKTVLEKAIGEGGTTLRDFASADGQPGYFAQQLNVYGRTGEACLVCDAPIQQKVIGQRSTFYCPVCQKF